MKFGRFFFCDREGAPGMVVFRYTGLRLKLDSAIARIGSGVPNFPVYVSLEKHSVDFHFQGYISTKKSTKEGQAAVKGNPGGNGAEPQKSTAAKPTDHRYIHSLLLSIPLINDPNPELNKLTNTLKSAWNEVFNQLDTEYYELTDTYDPDNPEWFHIERKNERYPKPAPLPNEFYIRRLLLRFIMDFEQSSVFLNSPMYYHVQQSLYANNLYKGIYFKESFMQSLSDLENANVKDNLEAFLDKNVPKENAEVKEPSIIYKALYEHFLDHLEYWRNYLLDPHNEIYCSSGIGYFATHISKVIKRWWRDRVPNKGKTVWRVLICPFLILFDLLFKPLFSIFLSKPQNTKLTYDTEYSEYNHWLISIEQEFAYLNASAVQNLSALSLYKKNRPSLDNKNIRNFLGRVELQYYATVSVYTEWLSRRYRLVEGIRIVSYFWRTYNRRRLNRFLFTSLAFPVAVYYLLSEASWPERSVKYCTCLENGHEFWMLVFYSLATGFVFVPAFYMFFLLLPTLLERGSQQTVGTLGHLLFLPRLGVAITAAWVTIALTGEAWQFFIGNGHWYSKIFCAGVFLLSIPFLSLRIRQNIRRMRSKVVMIRAVLAILLGGLFSIGLGIIIVGFLGHNAFDAIKLGEIKNAHYHQVKWFLGNQEIWFFMAPSLTLVISSLAFFIGLFFNILFSSDKSASDAV